MAQQLRDQHDLFVAVGQRLGQFLKEAYPHVQSRTCLALADSLVAFITCGTDRQIKSLTSPARHGTVTPDMLVYLTKQRDQLVEQLEQIDKAIETIPVEGMGAIFDASVGAPLRQRLEDIEEQMSAIQAELEKTPA